MKILVTEDEKSYYLPLSFKLKKEGYEVDIAENGKVALDLIDKNKYALVLLDLVMPVMDGFKVLESLRKSHSGLPVIVLSNLSQNEDRERIISLGANKFLDKSNTSLSDIVSEVKQNVL